MLETLQIKRGLESDRLNYTPDDGEIIITKDKHQLFVGDGNTPGGHLVNPFGVYEWNFSTAENQVEYSPEENEENFHSPNSGLYIVFYGAVRLVKGDYTVDSENNKFTLTNSPEESGIPITICYIGS